MRKTAALTFLLFFLGTSAMSSTLEMQIGGERYAIELQENDASTALLKRLPITLRFEDYGANERIAYLDEKLELGNAPRRCDPKVGDFTYYAPWGNLAVFVRDFRPSEGLVPLGHMDAKALRALQHSGNDPVTLRRMTEEP